jgi:hypothetical protein
MLSFKKTVDLCPYYCWKTRHLLQDLQDCMFHHTWCPQTLQSLCSVSVLWMSVNENIWICAWSFCNGISEWGTCIWWIVKIDKTWVHHYKPVSKQQSMSGNTYHAHNAENSEIWLFFRQSVLMMYCDLNGHVFNHCQEYGNVMPGWKRNLNLLFAVNTMIYCLKVLYCSRTKLNLIQPIQPLKWFENFTLNFSRIHCTVQILFNFTITCFAHWRSMTWLLIKMVTKVKI